MTASENERRDILRTRADRQQFLVRVAEMMDRFSVCLHDYLLLNNHYHLQPEQEGCVAVEWGCFRQ